MKLACGIDIGGSGVKGALVDLTTGTYSGESVLINAFPCNARCCCTGVRSGP